MSARIHAEAAIRAWRRQAPPPIPGSVQVAGFVAAPSLEELVLRACEDTAQEEQTAHAGLFGAARRLVSAARGRKNTPAPTWDLRGTVQAPPSEELLASVDLGPLARSVDALERRPAVVAAIDGAQARDVAAEVTSRAMAAGVSLRAAHEAVLLDEREEEGEFLARMLEADEAIGSGEESGRKIRAHYAAIRGMR